MRFQPTHLYHLAMKSRDMAAYPEMGWPGPVGQTGRQRDTAGNDNKTRDIPAFQTKGPNRRNVPSHASVQSSRVIKRLVGLMMLSLEARPINFSNNAACSRL